MPQIDFEIGGLKYRAANLNAFKQIALAMKLAGVAGALASFMDKKAKAQAKIELVEQSPIAMVEPILQAVAKLPQADVDFILSTCLEVVTMQQKGGAAWAPVQVGPGQLMFPDILDGPVVLQICGKVLEANLSSFFTTVLSGLKLAG